MKGLRPLSLFPFSPPSTLSTSSSNRILPCLSKLRFQATPTMSIMGCNTRHAMMVINKGGGLGRAVVGSVGSVRGDEKRREKRRYILAIVSKLITSRQHMDTEICRKSMQISLESPCSCPECRNNIHTRHASHRLPRIFTPLAFVFDDPPDGNETRVQPIKLKEDR